MVGPANSRQQANSLGGGKRPAEAWGSRPSRMSPMRLGGFDFISPYFTASGKRRRILVSLGFFTSSSMPQPEASGKAGAVLL
jgi:hypothetical protein